MSSWTIALREKQYMNTVYFFSWRYFDRNYDEEEEAKRRRMQNELQRQHEQNMEFMKNMMSMMPQF